MVTTALGKCQLRAVMATAPPFHRATPYHFAYQLAFTAVFSETVYFEATVCISHMVDSHRKPAK